HILEEMIAACENRLDDQTIVAIEFASHDPDDAREGARRLARQLLKGRRISPPRLERHEDFSGDARHLNAQPSQEAPTSSSVPRHQVQGRGAAGEQQTNAIGRLGDQQARLDRKDLSGAPEAMQAQSELPSRTKPPIEIHPEPIAEWIS